jgi:hypothetical protein
MDPCSVGQAVASRRTPFRSPNTRCARRRWGPVEGTQSSAEGLKALDELLGGGTPSTSESPRAVTGCSYLSADPRFQVSSWKFREVPDENGDDWSCISSYVEIGPRGAALENNLAYYLMGTQRGPRRAKLTLNVNVPADETAALRQFVEAARLLTRSALAIAIPAKAEQATLRAEDYSSTVAGKQVVIDREAFAPAGISGGFSLRYVISLQ